MQKTNMSKIGKNVVVIIALVIVIAAIVGVLVYKQAVFPPSAKPAPTSTPESTISATSIPTTSTPTLTPAPTISSAQPTIENKTSVIYLAEGQKDGPLLVQKIYPDHIDGLFFIQYPIEVENGTPSTLYIGQNVSNGCDEILTLIGIEEKKAKFLKNVQLNKPCPRCLSENTSIDTPNGSINVKNLHEGMAVWTSDKSGLRDISIILKTSKVAVPANHKMIHIVLTDSRELFASPGHPLADGRLLGSISTGDIIDGSKVTIAEEVPYKEGYTYDILPSGDTGLYWANGIPVRSTLVNR